MASATSAKTSLTFVWRKEGPFIAAVPLAPPTLMLGEQGRPRVLGRVGEKEKSIGLIFAEVHCQCALPEDPSLAFAYEQTRVVWLILKTAAGGYLTLGVTIFRLKVLRNMTMDYSPP